MRRWGIRLLAVMMRELKWLFTDRVAFCTLICIPLIALPVLSWTFSRSVIHDLKVAVVDADQSHTSLIFTQAVSASPSVSLSRRYQDLSAAAEAIRNGDIIATVYIPPEFEREMAAGQQPQIVLLYNNQYLTPGSVAANGLRGAINAATGAANEFQLTQFITGVKAPLVGAGPVLVSEAVQGNTEGNYAELLMRSVGPTVLHITITIIATFSMGMEFRRRKGLAEVLAVAGGSPFVALLGKSLPLLFIGITMMSMLAAAQNMFYGLTIKGSGLMIFAAEIAILAAYQGLGMSLSLLMRDMASSLGLAGMIISPAFGYAGVGMPIFAMNTFSQCWSAILPLRWYLQVFFDQATRGVPVQASASPFLLLLALMVFYNVIAWGRLVALSRNKELQTAKQETLISEWCKPTITSIMMTEIRRIICYRASFSFFIIGGLFYGVYYPQPYLGQIIRKTPIAVVDHDNSGMSQELIMALDATDALEIKVRASSLGEAQDAMNKGKVFAIVEIPTDMTRNILRGNTSSLPVYTDGTYFSIRSKTLSGIVSAVLAQDADKLAFKGREDSGMARFGMARIAPAELLSEPLYNPAGGYASYAVPAAFVLIIQQVLLLGAAGLSPLFPSRTQQRRPIQDAVIGVLGQTLAHTVMIFPATVYLFVIMNRVYEFSTLGSTFDLALMTIPFLLSTSLMAQAMGYWFKNGFTAVVLFVAVGLPIFFLVGAAWPMESIPPLLQYLAKCIPSSTAIDGIVRINQMGASLHGVIHNWLVLWLLTAVYFVLAVLPRCLLGKPSFQEQTV